MMTAKALKLLCVAKIFLIQERKASSDVAQVLDVTCCKYVQDACIRELETIKFDLGTRPLHNGNFLRYIRSQLTKHSHARISRLVLRKSVFSRLCLAMHE